MTKKQNLIYKISKKSDLKNLVKFYIEIQKLIDKYNKQTSNNQIKHDQFLEATYNLLAQKNANTSNNIVPDNVILIYKLLNPNFENYVLKLHNGSLTLKQPICLDKTNDEHFTKITELNKLYNEPINVYTTSGTKEINLDYKDFKDFTKKVFKQTVFNSLQIQNQADNRQALNEIAEASQGLTLLNFVDLFREIDVKETNIYTISNQISINLIYDIIPLINKYLLPKSQKFDDFNPIFQNTILNLLCPTYQNIFCLTEPNKVPAFYCASQNSTQNLINNFRKDILYNNNQFYQQNKFINHYHLQKDNHNFQVNEIDSMIPITAQTILTELNDFNNIFSKTENNTFPLNLKLQSEQYLAAIAQPNTRGLDPSIAGVMNQMPIIFTVGTGLLLETKQANASFIFYLDPNKKPKNVRFGFNITNLRLANIENILNQLTK